VLQNPPEEFFADDSGFVAIFRKEADGSWKAVQDINNAEAPATSK